MTEEQLKEIRERIEELVDGGPEDVLWCDAYSLLTYVDELGAENKALSKRLAAYEKTGPLDG